MPNRNPIAALLTVPFDEAIEYAKSRDVTLPANYYRDLKASTRERAFTVSHLASLSQIRGVLDDLNDAVADGGTFVDWRAAIEANGVQLGLPHAETVFRNGVQSAYNAGRRQQQAQNEQARPYLMYDAINDSRTRPGHRAMDGFIAPVGHVIWQEWYPPNGHQCRCSVISLSEQQAKRRGYTGIVTDRGARPDDGWGHDGGDREGQQPRLSRLAESATNDMPAPIRKASNKRLVKINTVRDPKG